jgi:peptidyl-Asp metalloendopeptidase
MSKQSIRVPVIVVVLALMAVSAYAADAPLFSSLAIDAPFGKALNQDASYRALADAPSTVALRIVKADAAALSEKAASLLLDLGEELDLRAVRTDSYWTKAGILVWSGVVAESGSTTTPDAVQFDPINSVMLVKNGDKITGNVHYNGAWYKIRPLESGGHAIVLVNVNAMPPDHPPSYADLPTYRMPRRSAGLAKVNTTIQVLVNYTPSAAAASGDIAGLINLAVAESNQGYANSGVSIDLVLAAQGPTTYTESGDFNTDLTRYRGTADGFMDEIHAARDASAADVAVLLINNTQYCGLASGIGSTAATAFVAVYWDCATGYYSFAHEIGHLQSARHDPRNDSTTTPYAWGHGFQYTKSPSWRTVMAYNCTGLGCPRLNYWSNPNNLYNGVPMGTANKNDNHRVLNDTRATVAAFR